MRSCGMSPRSGWKRWIAGRLTMGLLCAVVAGSAAAVDIYKWVDENGTTHYSNIRPSDVDSELVSDSRLSVIPGSQIGAEADRAAARERESAARSAADEAALQAQVHAQMREHEREQRIRDCERNRGIDCAREADTELRAEELQLGGVMRTVPPSANFPIAPVPRP